VKVVKTAAGGYAERRDRVFARWPSRLRNFEVLRLIEPRLPGQVQCVTMASLPAAPTHRPWVTPWRKAIKVLREALRATGRRIG
jgi:hypothetical protein